MSEGPRYAIGDLAELGGVSRRTVRYYVQENLLPAPLGVGRGNHYGPAHLDRLLQVKALQEAGRSLEEIRRTFESIEGAQRVIVHLYNSTSTLQRRVVFGLPRQGIVDIAVKGTRLIRELSQTVTGTEVLFEYSPESFTGTELEFSVEDEA